MKKRFIIYGLLGWCIEVLWTGFGALIKGDVKLTGQTYIWMFAIYGLAILLEPIHDHIRNWPTIMRGGIYTAFIFTIEYIAGWLLEIALGICPWYYTSTYAVNGYIRLDYAPAWFFAGLLFEIVHDRLLELDNLMELRSYRRTL